MQEVSVTKARQIFGALLRRIACGEEIVITRRGRPVARLLPHPNVSAIDKEKSRAAARRIRLLAKKLGLGPFNWEEFKAYRDMGRR